MPEGDTIHRLAQVLRPLLVGERIQAAIQGDGQHRLGDPKPLVGATVTDVAAIGKNLFIHMDTGLVLWSHLGLHGSWTRVARSKKSSLDLTLRLSIASTDIALYKAQHAQVMRAEDIARHPLLGHLGPDLLAPDFDPALAAARAIAAPDDELGLVVLDQRIACGVGNVYKSEGLFVARLQPFRKRSTTDVATLTRLYAILQRQLADNVTRPQRVTTSGPARRRSPSWVYDRTGRPCLECGTPITAARQGEQARMTYWCPHCQLA